jgi:Uma2 family endonuclease
MPTDVLRGVPQRSNPDSIPPLQPGDHLTRDEFERRYDATPGLKKAELINGVVYMAPPVSFGWHSEPHIHLAGWLWVYRAHTPGVRGGADSSVRMIDANMTQPDTLLFVDPARGGQLRIGEDDYLDGAPEFIGEVAATSAGYDLHTKLDLYRRAGVKEYLVWRTFDGEIDWFVARAGDYHRLTADASGVVRSEVFPGLWLDVAGLLKSDVAAVLNKLQEGLSSREHAEYVRRLASSHGG